MTAAGNDALLSLGFALPGGERRTLADFPSRAWLVVNTASQCGFTPQYEELEQLWRHYAGRGLTVLGFPCNQFGKQEPGTDAEIGAFCERRFAVTFPLLAKTRVNGRDCEPLFQALKARAPGLLGTRAIKWNFTKFLISNDASTVRRFAPRTPPMALRDRIEAALES